MTHTQQLRKRGRFLQKESFGSRDSIGPLSGQTSGLALTRGTAPSSAPASPTAPLRAAIPEPPAPGHGAHSHTSPFRIPRTGTLRVCSGFQSQVSSAKDQVCGLRSRLGQEDESQLDSYFLRCSWSALGEIPIVPAKAELAALWLPQKLC